MKSLETYLLEALISKKISKKVYPVMYFPKDKDELLEIIHKEIEDNGVDCDLNCIDTSKITDMTYLFSTEHHNQQFCGDVSNWDTSNVIRMDGMFSNNSKFDGDLSKWDLSKVENTSGMFFKSAFTGKNGDINNWNTESLENANNMFAYSKFRGDISDWNMKKCRNINKMFNNCPCDANLDKWELRGDCLINNTFYNSPMRDKYSPNLDENNHLIKI